MSGPRPVPTDADVARRLEDELARLASTVHPRADGLEQILALPPTRRLRRPHPAWRRAYAAVVAPSWRRAGQQAGGQQAGPTERSRPGGHPRPIQAAAAVAFVVALAAAGLAGASLAGSGPTSRSAPSALGRPAELGPHGSPGSSEHVLQGGEGSASGPAANGAFAPARVPASPELGVSVVGAFVSGNDVVHLVLPGRSQPVPLSGTGGASNVELSRDGSWVAFLRGLGSTAELVLQPTSGGAARILGSGASPAFAWAPGADLLAFSFDGQGLAVVPAGGGAPSWVVAPSEYVGSFAWSPSSTEVAVATTATGADPSGGARASSVEQVREFAVPTSGSSATPFSAAPVVWSAPRGDEVILAGWWPDGKGLVAWIDRGWSYSTEVERGLPLELVPLGGGSPTVVADTYPYLPWIAWSPDGNELAVVAGLGQQPWEGKRVVVCVLEVVRCRPVPVPAGSVSLDPSWAPDGAALALVVAEGGTPASGAGWYSTRRLYRWDLTGQAEPVRGAPAGVAAPVWLDGGRLLGFSTGSAIGVVPAGGGASRSIASGLAGDAHRGAGPDAIGKLPWSGVAVWATGLG